MRKTKIICTIGPASESEEILEQMILADMDMARLNFSHGTHEDMKLKLDRLKAVRDRMHKPIPIMLDTKGPEYRIGTFRKEKAVLSAGQTFTLTTKEVEGDSTRVSVSYSKWEQD